MFVCVFRFIRAYQEASKWWYSVALKEVKDYSYIPEISMKRSLHLKVNDKLPQMLPIT